VKCLTISQHGGRTFACSKFVDCILSYRDKGYVTALSAVMNLLYITCTLDDMIHYDELSALALSIYFFKLSACDGHALGHGMACVLHAYYTCMHVLIHACSSYQY
jgi:hypothetical protein